MVKANKSPVFARVDTDLKKAAERILARLGLTPSAMIQVLYNQIVMRNGVPFEVTIPPVARKSLDEMTQAELNEHLHEGINSGPGISADMIDAIFDDADIEGVEHEVLGRVQAVSA